MKKEAVLRGLKKFDIIFRSSDRMDTEFTGDFYFDFCRMSTRNKAPQRKLKKASLKPSKTFTILPKNKNLKGA